MNQKRTAGAVFAALGKAVCYLFLFLLCQTLVSVGYTLVIMLYSMLNHHVAVDYMGLVYACADQISMISGLATLVILAAFFLLRRKNPLGECGLRRTPGRYVFTAIAITPILYAAIIFVMGLLPEAWLADYVEASASLNQTGLLMAIATVVIAPIVEEVIFRGLILSRLRRAMPGWLAVLLSALIFGLCHGQAVWMAYAFVLGVIFGFLALRSGSLWPSLAAHVLFNGIGQASAYLPETDEAALWFTLALVVGGAVLCVLSTLYRTFRPLKDKNSAQPS